MLNSENDSVGPSGDAPGNNADKGINSNSLSPRGTKTISTSTAFENIGQIYAPPKFGTLVPNRVFVGGIASCTTEDDLNTVFSMFGQVRAIKIIQDRSGVSKGYGFVTYETEDEARRLFIAINSREIEPIIVGERRLNIAPAVKKQAVSPFDGQVGGVWPEFGYVQHSGVGYDPGPGGPSPQFYFNTNGNGQIQQLTQAQPFFGSYSGSSYSGTSYTSGPPVQHPLHQTYYCQQSQQNQSVNGICIIPQPAPLSNPLYYPPTPPPPHLTTINGNALLVTWVWNEKFRGWDTVLKSVGNELGLNNNNNQIMNGNLNCIAAIGASTTIMSEAPNPSTGNSNTIQRPEVGGGDADRNWPTRRNNEDSEFFAPSDIFML